MIEPVRILSDFHLGHKVSRIRQVSALRPLIAGAGTVIFNGDTWQELDAPFRQRSREMLEELQWLCAEEAVDAVFLPGNHDPSWPGQGWIELANGRIVISHGDSLLFDGSPWKREILRNREKILAMWQQFPEAAEDPVQRHELARLIARELSSTEHSAGRHLIQRAWDAAFPPTRALHMLASWIGQGFHGSTFLERYFPSAEVLVMGHFHQRGCWQHRGKLIINTGTFMEPGRAQWVEWSKGQLSRGHIIEDSQNCQLGEAIDLWRIG
jgi:predicted phosphodiesterase